jgi:ribosomal protein S16
MKVIDHDHMLAAPRNNTGFPTVGGFATDEERDEAMTLASDVDLAWVRQGRENSGTARNIARRVAG